MQTLTRTLFVLALAGPAACDSDPTTAGPPAQLDVVSGNDQQGTVGQELAQPLVVKVVDEDGKPVRDQLVNFRVTRGGGSVFAGSATTNREGVAQERWTLGTVADSQQVEVRAVDPETGAAIVFATFRAMARAGAASSVTPVQAQMTGQPGGSPADSAAVTVKDPHGNPVPGVTVNWAVTAGGGSVSPASSTTNAQGIARAHWVLGGGVAAQQTLQASAGTGPAATITGTATLGAGAVLAKVSGDAQTSAVWTEFSQPLVVELKQNGVPVQGATITWTASSGTVAGTATTGADGRASVKWTPAGQGGSQTVTAAVQGAAVTFTGTVTPGAPARVIPRESFEGSHNAGTTLPVTFAVTDVHGNPVPGVTVQFAANQGGSVTPASAVTNASGVASASWTLPSNLGPNSTITAQVTGTVAGIETPGMRSATVVAVATRLIASPETVTVEPGATAYFSAVLGDDFGNTFSARSYPGCVVVWSAPETVELTAVQGLQYPNAHARSNTPGTYTITAACNPMGLSDTITMIVQ